MHPTAIFAAGFMILFVGGGARFAIGLTLKPMVTEFGWARGELGMAVGAYLVVSAFATYIAGRLADRTSPRLLLTAGVIVSGLGIGSMCLVAQPWQAGQLKVLGFGSTARLPRYPSVPTLAESGLPGYEAGSWYGLFAPRGTPQDIVDKLSAQTQKIFNDPEFREKFLAPNFIYSITSSPAEFAGRIRADYEKWGKLVRDANVHVD